MRPFDHLIRPIDFKTFLNEFSLLKFTRTLPFWFPTNMMDEETFEVVEILAKVNLES
jgi:hypothetical protein